MNPNSPEEWDRIWSEPAEAEWRAEVLKPVYDRIVELVPVGSSAALDLGGGVGILASRLHNERCPLMYVWDHSDTAVQECMASGINASVVDLEALDDSHVLARGEIVVSTEVLEHLTEAARERILAWVARHPTSLLVSVPNNRLGPDEEPQHTIKWTALEFLTELREHFEHCRVEVIGGFLLGVCGELARKPFKLSACTPARDEEADIERTLASFRGVADELVVGIDPRSKDRTEEIARQYAEVVFTLEEPQGPEDDKAPAVHMSHIRNQCLDKCTGDWVFMTEAHESLMTGQDELLHLDQLPKSAKVAFVMRTGSGQRWAFPWLHVNHPKIRYRRATHNELDFPTKWQCIRLPAIQTLHKRAADTVERRKDQRKVQNRITLTEDWLNNKNDTSLLYLGSEWAEYDKDRAIARLQEFLALNRSNGSKRYHARLQCSKLLAQQGDRAEARAVLMGAVADDWSRVDHWFYLGDLALEDEDYTEALQFYRYVATRIEDPPFCVWWVDLAIYGYLCAERLTQCYAALGKLDEALEWAERVVELMPDDTPDKALKEAEENIERITEAKAKNAAAA
jgi:glycosyltransferase involved in cell wall biosynthesis